MCWEVFVLFSNTSLRTSTFRPNKRQAPRHARPCRRQRSRSRRDPCALERVAGARCFFFSLAGGDKTISLVSVREALPCTRYIRTGKFVVCILPHGHRLDIHCRTRETTGNIHRAQRSNGAALTPCVRDIPIRAVLLWLGCFYRGLRSAIHHLPLKLLL